MTPPVSLEAARAARAALCVGKSVNPVADVYAGAQQRVYRAIEIVLAAFLDGIITELQQEKRK